MDIKSFKSAAIFLRFEIPFKILKDFVISIAHHCNGNSGGAWLIGLKSFNCGYPIVYAQSKKSGRRRATELANFFIGTHLSYVEHYLPKTHADRQSKGAEHYEIRIFLLGKKCR